MRLRTFAMMGVLVTVAVGCGDDESASSAGPAGSTGSDTTAATTTSGVTSSSSSLSTTTSTSTSTSNSSTGTGGEGGAGGASHGEGGGPQCLTNGDCDDFDPCSDDACEGGICIYDSAPNGTACDDENACTSGEVCTAGSCLPGAAVSCDDQNPCTDDVCDATDGSCDHANNTAPCEDGNGCTTGDICNAGACVAGGPLSCEDNNVCTVDACSSNACGNTPVPDGLICMVNGTVSACDNGICSVGSCAEDYTLACAGPLTDTWNTSNGGSTNEVDGYACNDGETYTGNEYTYRFVAPAAGSYTVSLTGAPGTTDVLVLTDDGTGCNPVNCVDFGLGGAAVTFDATAGQPFYLVVDSVNNAPASYTINLDCGTEDCNDTLDNDHDGETDCVDNECFDVDASCPSCTPDDQPPFSQLLCPNDADFYNNVGEVDEVATYSCNGFSYAGAGEYVYTYEATADGSITVTDNAADLDMLVLEDTGLGCNPASCLTYGLGTVTFDAVGGRTYYIVIDGYNGAESGYSLTFTCQ